MAPFPRARRHRPAERQLLRLDSRRAYEQNRRKAELEYLQLRHIR